MDYSSFVKDTVGDVEAAQYGTPAKAEIPRFKRTGAGRVLGLDAALRIVNGSSSSRLEIAPGGSKRARYIDANANAGLLPKSRKRLRPNGSEASSLGSGKSFVPIEKSIPEKEHEKADTYLGHEFAGTNKRATEAEQSDEDSKSENSSDGSSEGSAISPQEELQERLRALDNKVRVDGSDTTSWLALVDIQAEVVEMSLRQDKTRSSKVAVERSRHKIQQSIAEVQMSVLERAARAHRANAASLPLITAKLELAASSGIWEPDRIEREWRQAIALSTDDWSTFTQLWNTFLTWKMSNADRFVLKDVLFVLGEALNAFRAAILNKKLGDDRSLKEKAALDIVRRAVDMLLQAGYVEQAHGILQALSEMTFRRPEGLKVDTEDDFANTCSLLKIYWDLEERRMCESASGGWAAFQETISKNPASINNKSSEETTSLSYGSFLTNLEDPDPIVRWLTLERARASLRHFSAKEKDEADWTTGELEVDPFSVVLYSDVAPFLVPIQSKEGKNILIDLVLAIIGASWSVSGKESTYLNHHMALIGRFWPSHFGEEVHTSSLELIEGELMQRPKASALNDPFETPIKTWRSRLDELFPVQAAEAEPWFALWETLHKDKATVAKTFLEQIKHQSTEVALARLGLSEVSQSHKAAKKLARLLLNQDRDNVVLWRAFARLERNNGSIDSVRTVYMSLLVANHPAKELVPAWSEWAELEWEAGELSNSLLILVNAAKCQFASSESSSLTTLKQQTLSKMDILRTQKMLDRMLSAQECNSHFVFCSALFRYLSTDADEAFVSAMAVFEQAMKGEYAEDCLEDIAMTHCKFIWRHIHGKARMKRSRAYVPKHITSIFSRYVLQFPRNSAFVSLLAAFEMTTKVENVLRGVLEEKMRLSKDTASELDWLMYLYCELHMNLHTVNENAVKRLFERALQSKSTRSSSLLWQLYLQFEVKLCRRKVNTLTQSRARAQADGSTTETLKESIRNDQRQCKAALTRAKSIFYRAIQVVPYCKALYLTAFDQPLRQIFPLDELLQLFQVMQDKDLRLYTDLTAFVNPSFDDTTISS